MKCLRGLSQVPSRRLRGALEVPERRCREPPQCCLRVGMCFQRSPTGLLTRLVGTDVFSCDVYPFLVWFLKDSQSQARRHQTQAFRTMLPSTTSTRGHTILPAGHNQAKSFSA